MSKDGQRRRPNVLITGTPGVGKTTLADALVCDDRARDSEAVVYEHIKVGQLIKEHHLFSEWDDQLNVPIFSEELVMDFLEPILTDPAGGKIVDFHSADFLPAAWFDLVILLRADTKVLYDRLETRGYNSEKIKENVESEIFQVVKDDILETFDGKVELWEENSNTTLDLDALVDKFFGVLGDSGRFDTS